MNMAEANVKQEGRLVKVKQEGGILEKVKQEVKRIRRVGRKGAIIR